MPDYTPSTEEVRNRYARGPSSTVRREEHRRAEFDRWLNKLMLEAYHQGCDEGYDDCQDHA